MATIVIKSAEFDIMVAELDTEDYKTDGLCVLRQGRKEKVDLFDDLMNAVRQADWFINKEK